LGKKKYHEEGTPTRVKKIEAGAADTGPNPDQEEERE